MKYSKQLFLLLMLFFSPMVFADEPPIDAESWSQKYVVVTSNSPHQLIPIYQDILADIENLDIEFSDLLAEKIVSPAGDDRYAKKATALLFRILRLGGSNRYVATLEGMTRPKRDLKFNQRLDRYLKKAKKDDPVEQYIVGSIDFEVLKKQYGQQALDSDVDFLGPDLPLSKLSSENTIQDMFDMFGAPQHMISGARRFTDGFISVNIKRLNYYYRGQGRVVFDYKKRKGWNLHSIVLDPVAFEEVMLYREYPDDFNVGSDYELHMAMLLSDGPISIRRVAEIHNAASDNANIEMLDVAAEKLLSHFKDSDEPAVVDAYAWLCKWLAVRGGSRYKDVLATVANNSSNAKLVKYAETDIEEKSDVPADLYQRGSVSLVELMKRYPSPYSI